MRPWAVAAIVVLCAAAPAEAVAPDANHKAPIGAPPPQIITLVLVGDTGFAPHMDRVRADGVSKGGRELTFAEATGRIGPLIAGDINFANIETVVTDRNDLSPTPKTFNFRTHPAGFAHLVERGFNLLSLANNHALDFGSRGAAETLRFVRSLSALGRIKGFAGLGGSFEEASRPSLFEVKGTKFAFSAMGIGGGGLPEASLGQGAAGQLSIHTDLAAVVERLSKADAEFRILSLHYGTEMQNRPDSDQVARWREEISRRAGIDLVVGHHSHVPQGIELTDGRLIFYGLGNFLHQGLSDMAGKGLCRDWGMLVRVRLIVEPGFRPRIGAVEVVPLEDMHVQTRVRAPEEGRRRIAALNGLARELDSAASGARGLRLVPQEDGSGLYCASGSDLFPEPLGSLCRNFRAADLESVPSLGCSGTDGSQVASRGENVGRGKRRSAEGVPARASGKHARNFDRASLR